MKWTDQYDNYQLLAENRLEKLYSADDLMSNRRVTIKEFKHPFNNREKPTQGRNRTQQMDHPNLMRVHDIGHQNQHYHISMEVADGVSLRELIKAEAPLRVDKAIAIAIQICDALDYLHSHGVQHQQVWPQNIFCQSNGLSKILFHDLFDLYNELNHLDHREMVPYLSPEQLQGFHMNDSSDLYSLSIVLYEMITGILPSTPNRDFSTFVDKQIFTPEFAGIVIPEPLIQVIQQGLSTRRYKRFQRAKMMKQALFDVYYQVCEDDISIYEEVATDSSEEIQPLIPSKKKYRPIFYTAVTVVAVSLFAVGTSYLYGEDSQDLLKTDGKKVERRTRLFDTKLARPPVEENQPMQKSLKRSQKESYKNEADKEENKFKSNKVSK